ncbi:ATP-binding protein [Micromonospora phytophila]|uniref:ATP-binding protein n=1 Tax=Micromonospora phytophila TaxID=709888 RepID=UPI00202F4E73|nr:ATP-binding protein [Micromonospora phytophila]MCM0677833.1 ATP-binding protein [Micromonospora phytophila]
MTDLRPATGPTMTGRSATATSATMSYTGAHELTAVRLFVAARALAEGLPPHRVGLLALAVTELATNTLQHTTTGGLVRVWAEPGRLVCDVVDQGTLRTFDRDMPTADAVRGRGLAIVARVCDEVAVFASPEGTVVRVRFRL